jgi:hypothetical protein
MGCYTELPVHPLAASVARSHVRNALTKWGYDGLSEDAELLISELTSNAIKAMSDIDRRETGSFWAGVYETCLPDCLVVVEVWDSTRTSPKLSGAGVDEVGGRGLWLVECLAADWGYRWPATGGKIVWAALEARGDDDP